jgi:hypothetical protein
MNKKCFWLLLPCILLPYFTLLLVAIVFLSTDLAVFEFIMDRVFQENGLYILVVLLIFCLLAVVFSITYVVLSIRKKWNPVSLAKCAMLIKWIQVPAYAAIFTLGLIFAITLFTIPIAIIFVLVDCLTLLLTGLLTISAAVVAVRQGIFQTKDVLWIVILQFVFCADVLAATAFYRKLKKRAQQDEANTVE